MTDGPRWVRREPPLVAAAVAANGKAAARLAAGAARRVRAGTSLRAAADADWLVVIGAPDDLPWADGARYLGWEHGVLVPTTQEPLPAADLWREVFGAPNPGDLLVLMPDLVLVAPMPVWPADPTALESWSGAANGALDEHPPTTDAAGVTRHGPHPDEPSRTPNSRPTQSDSGLSDDVSVVPPPPAGPPVGGTA
ncbi:hypothetical protein [Yinghuangia seranimata]|uniref:bpX5 domain-containing protein n=1 Tax=Yinghuangia seranimata TaxID=408067 RepID=UPI00248D14C9|nr:hypothetical protein [Yinghuangia seranimata]MDI2126623.1 hypothetical protein [Yinghuangia seranimata]